MTRPSHFESAIDRQIRIAQENGAFDDLPGKGKPLSGLDQPYDENWWARGLLEREGVSADMLLPESVRLRKELDRLPDTLREVRDEAQVRDTVRELNQRIAEYLRFPAGPRVQVAPLRVEEVVARWRTERSRPVPPPPQRPEMPPPRPWWRRFRRG